MANNDKAVYCPACNTQVGMSYAIADDIWPDGELFLLQAGGLLLRNVAAFCAQCGAPFYFSLSDQKLDGLIKRISNHATSSTPSV